MQDLETYLYSPSNIAKDQELYGIGVQVFVHPNKYPIETCLHRTNFGSHIGHTPTLFPSYNKKV